MVLVVHEIILRIHTDGMASRQRQRQRQQQQQWSSLSLATGVCVATAAGYLAYRGCKSKTISTHAATLVRAAEVLAKLGSGAAAASEALQLVATDLRSFLASDTDEVPPSLRQLAKLAQCPEVQDTIAACVGSAARSAAGPATDAALAVADRLLEAALSERGSSLVALAISLAAREGASSLVAALRDAVLSTPVSRQQQHHRGAVVNNTSSSSGNSTSDMAHASEALQSTSFERLLKLVVSSGAGSAAAACMAQAGGGSTSCDLLTSLMTAVRQPGNLQALSDVVGSMAGACTREIMAVAVGGSSGGRARMQQRPCATRKQQQQQQPRRERHQSQPDDAPAATVAAPALQRQQSATLAAELASRLEGCKPQDFGRARRSSASSLDRDCPDAGAAAAASSGLSTPNGPATPEPSVVGGASPARPLTLRLRQGSGGLPSSSASQLDAAAEAIAPSAPGWLGGSSARAGAQPLPWAVAACAMAAQQPELRSLILEASRCSTREAVKSLLPSFWTSGGGSSSRSSSTSRSGSLVLFAQLRRVQIMVSVLLFLVVFGISPRTVLPSTTGW